MTNMKKTFFNKLLLATSSIGLLASAESFAAVVVPVPGAGDFNISQISNPNSWRSNNGNFYTLQNNDNIILRRAHRIDLNEDITINTINIYGYSATAKVMEYTNGIQEEIVEGGIVISPNFNNRVVTINNIVNVDNAIYRNAGKDALGEALIYGNKNAKVRVDLRKSGHDAHLIITGNDISGADSIVMGGAKAKLTFQNLITVNTKIYSRGVF